MEKLITTLHNAIRMERQGRDIYLDAMDRVKSPVAQAVLLELASDEEEHERLITSYYEALQRHQGWPDPQGEDRELDLPDRATEMLEKTAEGFSESSTCAEIYEAALELETQSRDFYLSQSEIADDRRLVEFFRFLARVEAAHAKALRVLLDAGRGLPICGSVV